MDIFKQLGITVGNKSLINETVSKSESNDKEMPLTQWARIGQGDTVRDRLDAQLSKGMCMVFPIGIPLMRKELDRAGQAELKNTHGEQFHTDNDKQVEEVLTSVEEIHLSLSREELFLKAMGVTVLKAEKISMPKKEFVAEHKKLVGVLNSPSHKDDLEEAKEQKKELQVKKSELNDCLDDIIKGFEAPSTRVPKKAPKQPKDAETKKVEREQLKEQAGDLMKNKAMPAGVSKKEFAKVAGLHENSPGIAEKRKPVPFIKSEGPGGVVFDFGWRTGNAMADNATKLINDNVDVVQLNNAKYQQNTYNAALTSFVKKGEEAFMQHENGIDFTGGHLLNKTNDQQVKEEFEKGTYSPEAPKAPITRFSGTQMMLNGELIKACSETDAALIQMMNEQTQRDSGGGFVADCSQKGITVEI